MSFSIGQRSCIGQIFSQVSLPLQTLQDLAVSYNWQIQIGGMLHSSTEFYFPITSSKKPLKFSQYIK